MLVYKSSSTFKNVFSEPIVAIGNFDGVHLGHQEILSHIKKKAKEMGGLSVVYTFDPPPSRILRPTVSVPQIHSLEERLSLFENYGLDIAIIEPFTKNFSQKSALQFFNEIILHRLKAKYLYVGYNFFFGKDRQGTPELLQEFCNAHNIELHVIKPFKIKSKIVSSTKIRHLILLGHVQKATFFLGRPYSIQGVVVQGSKRGEALGIPTANLKTEAELIPKEGVYITKTEYQGKLYPSVTSVGRAPTFTNHSPVIIETHFLDVTLSLYRESLLLHFVKRLRDIKKFPTPEALIKQIHKDIAKTRSFLVTQ